MAPGACRPYRWSRVEYERLVDVGMFQPGEHLELVDGRLIVREPQPSRHVAAIRTMEESLRAAFGPDWEVRTQAPFALDDASEPEPDVAVVAGSYRDYRDAHPSRAVLLVEVAETTLSFDREDKGSLYARAGIPEYWIVNLVEDLLEVSRDPMPVTGAVHGWGYREVRRARRGEHVTPLAAPTARIPVDDLLP